MTELVFLPRANPLARVDRSPVAAETLTTLENLAAGFLASKRSVNARAAHRRDLMSWFNWCISTQVAVLAAGIHHADVYLRLLAEHGDPTTGRTLAAASIGRRASALNGFYRYATRHGAVSGSPFDGIERPPSMTSPPPAGSPPPRSARYSPQHASTPPAPRSS